MANPIRPAGTYIVSTTGEERVKAFVAPPLPPDPPLQLGSPVAARGEADSLHSFGRRETRDLRADRGEVDRAYA